LHMRVVAHTISIFSCFYVEKVSSVVLSRYLRYFSKKIEYFWSFCRICASLKELDVNEISHMTR